MKAIVNEITFTIDKNNEWDITVYGNKPGDHVLQKFPKSLEDIDGFVKFFSENHLCPGIPDFQDVIKSRLEIRYPFPSTVNQNHIANVETLEHCILNKEEDYKLIRHKGCCFFVRKSDDNKICGS